MGLDNILCPLPEPEEHLSISHESKQLSHSEITLSEHKELISRLMFFPL